MEHPLDDEVLLLMNNNIMVVIKGTSFGNKFLYALVQISHLLLKWPDSK